MWFLHDICRTYERRHHLLSRHILANKEFSSSGSSPLHSPNINRSPPVHSRTNRNPFVESSDDEGDSTPPQNRTAEDKSTGQSEEHDSQSAQHMLRGETDESESWVHELRSALAAMETSIDLTDIVPGLGQENQCLIDADFISWIPSLPPTASRRRTLPRKLPVHKRTRRRVLYSRFQRMWKRQRAKAADTVLDGTWNQDASDVPLETQDRYSVLLANLVRDSVSPRY